MALDQSALLELLKALSSPMTTLIRAGSGDRGTTGDMGILGFRHHGRRRPDGRRACL